MLPPAETTGQLAGDAEGAGWETSGVDDVNGAWWPESRNCLPDRDQAGQDLAQREGHREKDGQNDGYHREAARRGGGPTRRTHPQEGGQVRGGTGHDHRHLLPDDRSLRSVDNFTDPDHKVDDTGAQDPVSPVAPGLREEYVASNGSYFSASQELCQMLSPQNVPDEIGVVRKLEVAQACELEKQSWSVVPQLFQDLTKRSNVALMEVACSPSSVLTSTVQRLTGSQGSAVRCAKWNGCDLSKGVGVKLILQRIQLEEPAVLWISPPCGPYSPLQNANARTEAQKAELQAKREEAMRIYVGSCVVIHQCIQRGTHVVLELSERCQAWRLPIFQRLQAKYQLLSAVTKGCRVGLRVSDSKPLMQKGWRILTTHHRLAQVLELPCRCPKHCQHDRCEGSKASRSELYTREYARRATRAILQELDHTGTLQECQGQSKLLPTFGEGFCCVCTEVSLPQRPRSCGYCLMAQGEVVPTGHDEAQQVLLPRDLEQQAETLLDSEAWDTRAVGDLLSAVTSFAQTRGQQAQQQASNRFVTLGCSFRDDMSPESEDTLQLTSPVLTQLVQKYMAQTSRHAHIPSTFVLERVGATTQGLMDSPPPEGFGSVLHVQMAQVSDGTHVRVTACKNPHVSQGSQQQKQQWCRAGFEVGPFEELACVAQGSRTRPQEDPASQARHQQQSGGQILTRQEQERIKKQLYLLHSATGHGSTASLVALLKRRQARPEVLSLAKEFKCSVCAEGKRPQPRNLASLEALPPKWHTVSADIGHWKHPGSKEIVQFMVVIDEGSRFRVAKILSTGSKQTPSASVCIQFLREGWAQYFGMPKALRLDSAASFRSQAMTDMCDREGIFLDNIPADAHWQLGVCEQAVRGLKEVMDHLARGREDVSSAEALALAVTAFNTRESVRSLLLTNRASDLHLGVHG